MTPHQFVAKWQAVDLSERSACQQHFLDLCELLDHPKPAEVDPKGEWFTFERGVDTSDDRTGWADVWLDQKFGWEYKGKHKNLRAAYQQLLKYRESLNNPPLLIVCDLDRFEIHCNFTGFPPKVYEFNLEGLKDARNVQILRHAFTDPERLKPDRTQEAVTREIADGFANLADGLRKRGERPDRAAHFLMKLVFCMFAEDIDLLPRGLFTELVGSVKNNPEKLSKRLRSLFEVMSNGGDFGTLEISHFNGGLFADAEVIDLTPLEIKALYDSARSDWGAVEPSIFGTLFERCLDPHTRAKLGAQYTSREDIETILKPVFEAPLRREWSAVKAAADDLFERLRQRLAAASTKNQSDRRAVRAARKQFDDVLEAFAHRLTQVHVLDPACGSGNFLYVALRLLLDLEKEVRNYAADHSLTLAQAVRPTQMLGLEINEYAQQLAQEVIWIGFLQWIVTNGDLYERRPILDPLDTISKQDAILDLSDPTSPKEPAWPAAEFIIGNPPFVGGNLIRRRLGDEYVEQMFATYGDRLPGFSDLCCYWFEKARHMVQTGQTKRVGLVATQSIRGGVNRTVLDRIKETGDIFFAISDRDWTLDGATVHISMVGFDDGTEQDRLLNGRPVDTIHATLSAGLDTTAALPLPENQRQHVEGTKKGAHFEPTPEVAAELLETPNPHGRPNSDVVRLYFNGADLTQQRERGWIIYYPPTTTQAAAALYEGPFRFVREHVFEKYGEKRKKWWVHERPRPEMITRLPTLSRYLCIVKHSKHSLFVWVPAVELVSNAIEAFFREDDYFYGIVHSRIHDQWARAPGRGTQVREVESGFRYTPTTCFDTFPFPRPTQDQHKAVATAANELDRLRGNWLNPPEWTKTEMLEFPGSVTGPWHRYIVSPRPDGVGTVRYPRVVPKTTDLAEKLKARNLTSLYNERPDWLRDAHRALDEAVFAAYGWPADLAGDELLARVLALNLERAGED